jgi:hypothetical protein
MPEKNRRFCGLSCNAKWMHSQPEIRKARDAKISKAFVELHKKNPHWAEEARERMTTNSPMKDPANRAKMSETLKRIGHKPSIRGGNGTGPTAAEKILCERFPEAKWNYAITTGMKRGSGYPQSYKVDLGFPIIRLGVEADGGSHCSLARKMQDNKKVEFLRGLGWAVCRFSNQDIINRTDWVVDILKSLISVSKATQATPSTD